MLFVMTDFEFKRKVPVNMCETVKLCQEEDADHYDILLSGFYINLSDNELSHTERSTDKLCQIEDKGNDDPPRSNYSNFR